MREGMVEFQESLLQTGRFVGATESLVARYLASYAGFSQIPKANSTFELTIQEDKLEGKACLDMDHNFFFAFLFLCFSLGRREDLFLVSFGLSVRFKLKSSNGLH